MAPRQQHTFTLVPNPMGMQGLMSRPPADAPQSKPPMTSKQAQKLYREANRAPRVSKAEQRRLDREEQDRIRRELDKEKQANKARILRDKKKAKEQQALDEKRRKGLPLVTVRPSQDTIARFVRGNGAGKKREAEGVEVAVPILEKAEDEQSTAEDKTIASDKETIAREVKRRRLSQRSSQIEKVGSEGAGMTAKADHTRGRNENAGGQESKHGKDPTPPDPSSNSGARETRTSPPRSEDGKHPAVSVGHGDKTIPDESTKDKRTWNQEKPRHGGGSSQAGKAAACVSMQPAKLPVNIVQPKPTPINKDEVLAEGTPPNTTAIPRQHETPAQRAQERENTPAAVPKPPTRQHGRQPTPIKTPANIRPAQPPKPCPPPPKSRAIQPPQQQRPSQVAPPAQQSPPRKPLQETTNSLNRDRPPALGGGPPKFASPYRPPLQPSRRQPSAPAPTPSFKQPRPETPTGKAQNPQFLRPHHHTAPLQQQPGSTGGQKTINPSSGFISAPPTSTQLFIMAHLDDLCPSPSQEARELEGDEPSAVVAPPKAISMPPPPIPRSANKPDSSASRFARQALKARAPMAPPPRPKPAKPAAPKPAEIADFPFFSTQDLLFSSQDLRDINEPTTTPCKIASSRAHGNPPPFKPRQGPSPLGRHSKPAQQPAPRFCPKQAPAPRKPLPRADAPLQQEPQKPAALLRQTPPILQPVETSQPSQPTPCPVPGVRRPKENAAREDPPRPPSPEKLRFFGSSGGGIDLLRAVCESRKSHQEEERRRQAEQAARQPKQARQASQRPKQSRQASQQRHQPRYSAREDVRNKGPGTTESDTCKSQRPLPTANCNTKPTSQAKPEPVGDKPAINTCSASQETDYGDVELDAMDFDELGLDVVQMLAAEPEQKVGGAGDGRPGLYDFDDLDDCMLDDDDGPWI